MLPAFAPPPTAAGDAGHAEPLRQLLGGIPVRVTRHIAVVADDHRDLGLGEPAEVIGAGRKRALHRRPQHVRAFIHGRDQDEDGPLGRVLLGRDDRGRPGPECVLQPQSVYQPVHLGQQQRQRDPPGRPVNDLDPEQQIPRRAHPHARRQGRRPRPACPGPAPHPPPDQERCRQQEENAPSVRPALLVLSVRGRRLGRRCIGRGGGRRGARDRDQDRRGPARTLVHADVVQLERLRPRARLRVAREVASHRGVDADVHGDGGGGTLGRAAQDAVNVPADALRLPLDGVGVPGTPVGRRVHPVAVHLLVLAEGVLPVVREVDLAGVTPDELAGVYFRGPGVVGREQVDCRPGAMRGGEAAAHFEPPVELAELVQGADLARSVLVAVAGALLTGEPQVALADAHLGGQEVLDRVGAVLEGALAGRPLARV